MKIAYVFPGQGAQYVGMGKDLVDGYEAARAVYEVCDEVLGFSLSELCFAGPDEELKRTYHTQPALLATSIAALRALQSQIAADVQPVCVAGHSLGEYTACVAAGALDLTEAIHLVRQRGQWMDEAVPSGNGAMAAVLGLGADPLAEVCREASTEGETVELANVNCPGQIVISGARAAVERASAMAREQGAKRCIPLVVSGPFHSSLMAPAADKLAAALRSAVFRPSTVPVVANVDAAFNTDPDALRTALAGQLCTAVQWEMDVRAMLDAGVQAFVEIGPGTVLSGLIRKIDKGIPAFHVEDEASLQEAIAGLQSVCGRG